MQPYLFENSFFHYLSYFWNESFFKYITTLYHWLQTVTSGLCMLYYLHEVREGLAIIPLPNGKTGSGVQLLIWREWIYFPHTPRWSLSIAMAGVQECQVGAVHRSIFRFKCKALLFFSLLELKKTTCRCTLNNLNRMNEYILIVLMNFYYTNRIFMI